MLNRYLVISILAVISVATFALVSFRFGLASINNWMLILSTVLLCMAIYKVLGMVEGYRN